MRSIFAQAFSRLAAGRGRGRVYGLMLQCSLDSWVEQNLPQWYNDSRTMYCGWQ